MPRDFSRLNSSRGLWTLSSRETVWNASVGCVPDVSAADGLGTASFWPAHLGLKTGVPVVGTLPPRLGPLWR